LVTASSRSVQDRQAGSVSLHHQYVELRLNAVSQLGVALDHDDVVLLREPHREVVPDFPGAHDDYPHFRLLAWHWWKAPAADGHNKA
jgi:hypothetical protein